MGLYPAEVNSKVVFERSLQSPLERRPLWHLDLPDQMDSSGKTIRQERLYRDFSEVVEEISLASVSEEN